MSRKKIPVVLFLIGIVLIFAAVIWFFFSRQFGSAVITIDSVPEANVHIEGELVGRTPYSGEFNAGEVHVTLLPLAFDTPRIPFESKVKLTAGVETVVRRVLGETELDSSGEIISFEKTGQKTAALTVVTTPDNAEVMIEGKPSEHSPVRFIDLENIEYTIRIMAQGYEEKTIQVTPQDGYTLTALVNLAKKVQEDIVEEDATEVAVSRLVIKSTPTGFLRVRSGPSQDEDEVAQVKPDEEYDLLETSEDTEWYRIESGWISSEYAEIKEQEQQ